MDLKMQEELRTLLNEYNSKQVNEDKRNNVMKKWGVYKIKILDNSLSLDDYTNNVNNDPNNPGGYLCNFLENSTQCFGLSRPGSANQFGVKKTRTTHIIFRAKVN